MEPNFSTGDYLVVDELSYRFRDPQRGEVIVLNNPTDNKEFFIKRIVGLPGEEILIVNNKVFVDGASIEEKYIASDIPMSDTPPFLLRENEYFVMGDNRPSSYDSRNWGPLGEHQIVGVVRLRFWPLNELSTYSI
jgi:signal peptidase I